MNKFKKNDLIVVITGKDRGKEGKILKVIPKDSKVIVENINTVTKHEKPSYSSAGGKIKKPMPLDWSNVAHKDPKSGKPSRVKFVILDGEKKRVLVKSGEKLD